MSNQSDQNDKLTPREKGCAVASAALALSMFAGSAAVADMRSPELRKALKEDRVESCTAVFGDEAKAIAKREGGKSLGVQVAQFSTADCQIVIESVAKGMLGGTSSRIVLDRDLPASTLAPSAP